MRIPAYGKNNPALSLNKVPGCFYRMPSVFSSSSISFPAVDISGLGGVESVEENHTDWREERSHGTLMLSAKCVREQKKPKLPDVFSVGNFGWIRGI